MPRLLPNCAQHDFRFAADDSQQDASSAGGLTLAVFPLANGRRAQPKYTSEGSAAEAGFPSSRFYIGGLNRHVNRSPLRMISLRVGERLFQTFQNSFKCSLAHSPPIIGGSLSDHSIDSISTMSRFAHKVTENSFSTSRPRISSPRSSRQSAMITTVCPAM